MTDLLTGRVLALDLGSVRIGVAVSDYTRTLATPRPHVRRTKSHRVDHAELLRVAQDEEATLVVVGLPRSLSGAIGKAAQLVFGELDELRAAFAVIDIKVTSVDERFSTRTASERLHAAGKTTKDQRLSIDSAAAAVFLQHWLDSNAKTGQD